MSNVLVVGPNGFLGRNLAAALVASGAPVSGAINVNTSSVPDGVRLVSIDKLETLDDDYEAVYNVAAFIPYGALNTPDDRFVEANVRLVDRIVSRWPRARHVLASSISVYGSAPGPLTEDLVSVNPLLYGLSKLAGELVAMQASSFAIIRFSSLCGAGMNGSTFLPRIVEQARTGGVIPVWGDGSRRQDYLHVSDAVALLLRAAEVAANGVFLGVHGETVANREAAEYVVRKIPGTRVEFQNVDNSPSFIYDPTRTRAILGVVPNKTAFDALDELVG